MNKHISNYPTWLNESVGSGSVVLIKGKEEGGKRKLFATHVKGSSEPRPGVTMLFLSDDFYRIIEVDGKLKAVKIGYRSDDSLKSTLNLKSPGKISVVKNNTKTPFHWKTLKHTNLASALREVEPSILGESEYLFESVDPDFREKMITEYSNYILKKTLRSAFFGTDDVYALEYSVDSSIKSMVNDADESAIHDLEWEASIDVFDPSEEVDPYLEYFEAAQPIRIAMTFSSDIDLEIEYDRGDYDTPASSYSSISDITTKLTEIYLEGDACLERVQDPELKQLISEVRELILNWEDTDLEKAFAKNIQLISPNQPDFNY